ARSGLTLESSPNICLEISTAEMKASGIEAPVAIAVRKSQRWNVDCNRLPAESRYHADDVGEWPDGDDSPCMRMYIWRAVVTLMLKSEDTLLARHLKRTKASA